MPSSWRKAFRRPVRPDLKVLTLSAAIGAVAATGQAPLDLWWLSLGSFALLTELVVRRASLGQMIWAGWLAGTGYFAAALFWIYEPFQVEADIYGWMAPFAVLFMAVGMALFWGLAAAFAGFGRGRATRALGFAIGLTATDLLRGYVLTGFPWALAGHIWIGTPVAQMSAYTGPVGLSALTMLAAALPVLAARAAFRGGFAALAAVLIAAVWAGGSARLAVPVQPRAAEIRVRLVQPNARQELKWREDMWQLFLDRQLRASAPGDGPRPDLIVWPETSVPWLLERAQPFLEDVAMVSAGIPVALGIQRRDGTRYYNSLAVIGPGGTVTATYDKWHLVPFGEYIPFGDLLAYVGISAFAAREGMGYSAGEGAKVLPIGRAGKVLPLICYEAVFPQDLNAAPERADWILQITNDAWFGDLAGPYQHLAQARLRAIEQGLPLLRAANTGVSAVIDAHGRILQSLPLDTDGVIDAVVPPALSPTPYSRTGDLPATILLVVATLALLLIGRRERG
ncbi:MAG TPA: apolipoprotein N-acyltransferase [Albidovulum sp.]|uniref:apolipoprotein N-acyltransferase n=1 Tax=Albidovulum sp. TaxID=1872424 RepID=UPI002B8FF00B|nr:apolipoprotein N-acyltransferase [Albidovulum sp.]